MLVVVSIDSLYHDYTSRGGQSWVVYVLTTLKLVKLVCSLASVPLLIVRAEIPLLFSQSIRFSDRSRNARGGNRKTTAISMVVHVMQTSFQ